MAVTAIGFDGVTSESAAAKWLRFVGRGAVVGSPTDFAMTVASGDRNVSVAAGDAFQHGVLATNSGASTQQAGIISSGVRNDTIVIRRDWTANTAALVVVAGGTTQAVSASIKAETVGVGQVDQPIGLMQVTAGQQQPTALVDLREFWTPSGLRWFASTAARDYWWPDAPAGAQCIVTGVGQCTKMASGSWSQEVTLTLTNTSGWQVHSSYGSLKLFRDGRMRYLSGRVARIVQSHPAGATSPFLNVDTDDRPPRTHTFFTRAGNGGGVAVVGSSDGLVQLEQAFQTVQVGQWVDLNTSWMV